MKAAICSIPVVKENQLNLKVMDISEMWFELVLPSQRGSLFLC